MGRFKKAEFHFKNGDEKLSFNVQVHIDADGFFYCNFEEEVIKFFKERGVKFQYNSRTKKFGYLSDESYSGLCKQIKEYGNDAVSRKKVCELVVIKYHIETSASYCLSKEGEVVPDGYYAGEGGFGWQDSTIITSSSNPHPAMISFFVSPKKVVTYEYKSGRQTKEYEWINDRDINKEEKPYLHWLSSIRNVQPKYNVKEIEYNEDVAKFFVDFYIGLCRMNEMLRGFHDSDSIMKFVESKSQLYLSSPKIENKEL